MSDGVRLCRMASIALVAWSAPAEAAPRAHAPARSAKQLGPLELYRAARAACGRPGPRIAEFMHTYFQHWLGPAVFGARVLADWDTLTNEQRARFEAAADAKVLAPKRDRWVASLCDPRDEVQFVLESSDGTTLYEHVMIEHHVSDDAFQVGWVLAEHGGEWSLDHSEVPSMDYPDMDDDPIDQALRRQLADYDAAMTVLGG